MFFMFKLQGTFSVGGQTACTNCPAGQACPQTTTDSAYNCTTGYYSDGMQTVSTNIPLLLLLSE